MRTLNLCIPIVLVVLAAVWPPFAAAHEFETGHIERSIDVIVRDRDVQLKYSLGLADETIVDWLAREELLEASQEARFRKCIAELKSKRLQNHESDSKMAEATSSDGGPPDFEALEFQTELMELLKDRLADSVQQNLHVLADGKLLEIKEAQATSASRQHVALEIVLKTTLPREESLEFSVTDKNFLQTASPEAEKREEAGELAAGGNPKNPQGQGDDFLYFGNVKMAFRVKGNAVLTTSNVAPVLARANATDVGPLTRQQRIAAATIRCNMVFVGANTP